MLLLVTIGLVVVAAVALVIGFVSSTVAWIYVSIACSAVAGLVLYLFSRMSRRRVPAPAGTATRRRDIREKRYSTNPATALHTMET